jgi:hypothetical protein
MTTVGPTWCNYCKHYAGYGVCRAFPDGIPYGIYNGDPHDTPVPEQRNADVFTLDKRKQAAFDEDQPYLRTAADSVG